MRQRIADELALLLEHFPGVEHVEQAGEDWFRVPAYPFPAGWRLADTRITAAPVVFRVSAAHPAAAPYAFLSPAGINFESAIPGNSGAAGATPFPGSWHQFSWAPDGGWNPSSDVRSGSNLLQWVRSFASRLREGA